MEKNKKQIRTNFRKTCFERDGYCCVMCGLKPKKEEVDKLLNCHHIIDRTELANGGYVKENGIALCDVSQGCHWKAEQYHATGKAYPGYSPEELFAKIGSSAELAISKSKELIS